MNKQCKVAQTSELQPTSNKQNFYSAEHSRNQLRPIQQANHRCRAGLFGISVFEQLFRRTL